MDYVFLILLRPDFPNVIIMKKTLSFIMLSLLLIACNEQKKEPVNPEPVEPTVYSYSGSIFVEFMGKEYETKDIKVDFVRNDGSSSTLKLYKVRFVPQMPVTVDLDVPNIPYSGSTGNYTFAGTNIVPTMKDNPYEKYTAKDIKGTATETQLNFSLIFGDYPTRYAGSRISE